VKKIIALISVLVIIILVISGCSGDTSSTANTTTPVTSPAVKPVSTPVVTTPVKTPSVSHGPKVLEAILAKAKPVAAVKYDWTYDWAEINKSTGENKTYQHWGTDWVKGKNIRQHTESENPVDYGTIIINNDNQTMTTITGKATDVMGEVSFTTPLNSVSQLVGSAVFLIDGTDYYQDLNETVVGTEIMDGKECTVLLYESTMGSRKFWIWNEYGLIIRWEDEIVSSGDKYQKLEWNFFNFDFSDIPDSMFK
jgi:outer membrane lipoprotein-sorting protein